jgi:serine protease Do
MKKFLNKPLLIILGTALMLPVALLAQKDDKEKDKEKKDKEKHESQQIIISRNGSKDEKIVVEVNGDKVTVNGKPIEEYKGDDVIVRRNRSRDTWAFGDGQNSWGLSGNDNLFKENFKYLNSDSNRALLGVTTDEADKGVEVQSVSKESAASKAGLKEGDVITKIDDTKIDNPDELTKVIRGHKPGDKVTVTYLRDDKEQKATAELGKVKGFSVYSAPNVNFNDNFNYNMPRLVMPRQSWSWAGGSPKLGLSVQDTDDGKGVKVIGVDDEGNAEKAGVKEDDVITEVDGKAVNSADEVAKIIKESKDKNSVMLKLTRAGKTQNIEVKIPRKLKTADL